MSFVSYAQNFEDVRLWRAFSDIVAGRYIDVGTQDPKHDSVSLAFYERGWRGIHVEPTPTYAAAMRTSRPDELIVEAAVSTLPGPIRFFEIPSTGLSTGIQYLAEQHVDAGFSLKELLVPTVTLASLFDLVGDAPIHWLKVDVEGMEADALSSWGDHPARPAALVIEATAPNSQKQTHLEWYDLVLSRGYRDILFDGLSRYFIHETYAERGTALSLSPNVFDGFQLAPSHFAAGKLRAENQAAVEMALEEAETRHNEAVEAAAKQAEAELETLRADLYAKLTESERDASTIREELYARREEYLTLLRETGRLEGQLAVQVKTAELRLADAEIVRRDLADRLANSELSHLAAQRTIADWREKIHLLTSQHDDALKQVSALLEASEVRATHLADQLTMTDQRLAECHARNEQAERHWVEASVRDANFIDALNAALEQLRTQVALREKQLAQAAQLLSEAPDPLAGWPQQVATLLARLAGRKPAEAVAAHGVQMRSWLADLPGLTGSPLGDGNFKNVGALEPKSNWVWRESAMFGEEGLIDTVPKLLAPHDAEFINVAYKAVLGRAPDAPGGTYYLSRLRTGTHKLEILRQLRRSSEGVKFVPGVAGLDRVIREQRLANLPILGPIVRLFVHAEADNATQRHLRVIANDIGRLHLAHAALSEQVASLSWNQGITAAQAVENVAITDGPTSEQASSLSISSKPRQGLAGFFQSSVWGH